MVADTETWADSMKLASEPGLAAQLEGRKGREFGEARAPREGKQWPTAVWLPTASTQAQQARCHGRASPYLSHTHLLCRLGWHRICSSTSVVCTSEPHYELGAVDPILQMKQESLRSHTTCPRSPARNSMVKTLPLPLGPRRPG